MDRDRILGLIVVLLLIGAAIYFLDGLKIKAEENDIETVDLASEGSAAGSAIADKKKMYTSAKEIVDPSGFVHVEDFKLAEHIGQEIILVDFWTYSCINCQRTQPYLNAWQEKYKDQGLTIVGIHTPEFEFEKDINNVRAAVEKAGIKYPVVLDNNYATWRAYGNRYWPRKYLIDIDGYIVYDHIGEGGYDETENKIQALLTERAKRLEQEVRIDQAKVQVLADEPSKGVSSPEVYFGALRNELLANGRPGVEGHQDLIVPSKISLNQLLLGGNWNIQPEFAASETEKATITFRYKAKRVFMVAAAEPAVTITVRRDGQKLGKLAGQDVGETSQVVIGEERLYDLVNEQEVEEHTLELIIEGKGLKAFTFTFG